MILKEFLVQEKITPDDFSKIIGSALATVYRWMDGSRKPSPDFLIRIMKATDGLVTANDFYYPSAKEAEKK